MIKINSKAYRLILCTIALLAGGQAVSAVECCPHTTRCTSNDYYLEGYIQSLIDSYYCRCKADVVVNNGNVYLSNLPNNFYLNTRVLEEIACIPGVCHIDIVCNPPAENQCVQTLKRDKRNYLDCSGVWFPQYNDTLWQALIADPRQVMFYAAYRAGDNVIGSSVAAVSFGDNFPIYQWCDVEIAGMCGDMQIGIEGDVFAVFNINTESHDLVNADYYVGIPVTYAWDRWSWRLRLYHISSHLGDEYLLDHPGIVRYNPAIEALDFFTSYQLSNEIRLYAGIGDYFISDAGFRQHPLYLAYGFEVKIDWIRDCFRNLAWRPFIAVYIENREMDNWFFNQNYSVGMELGQVSGIGKKTRVSLEWYNGYSQDGQLSRFRTSYGQLKLAYGF